MRPYVVRPAAAGDIKRAYEWYERARPGLGEEFLLEVRAAIDVVLAAPESFPVVYRETHRALVRRFPYGLLYRPVQEVVVFVACAHMRRAPERWKRRR